MAKKTISFGTPPLGIGGDTYKSAFEKCNANFSELYATASSKYATSANNQLGIYKDVASFHNKSNALKGAIVIHLPKTRNKSNTMSLWTIRGYNYTTNNGAWELKVGGYNYSSGWLQYSANLDGPAPFEQVQLGWATDHQVIILGLATTTWSYPIIHIPELITGYSNIGNWGDVTIAAETVLTGYTKLVTPVLYGNNRVRAAEALLYSRKINGVAFNGTQDITVADGTKLPLTGGTITGALTAKGKVQADGGIQGALTGNASTATKLQTARTINGKSFNGTANVSINTLEPVTIPASANFNSYQTPGMYFCPANATAKTLVNRPTDNAFSLLVEKHAGVKQTVTEYMASGHKTYIRNMYSNAWGAWVRVHTTIDAPLGGQFLGNQATKAIAYNAQNISENVTIPGNVNALSAGPITINNGKTVTISTGGTWTIV